MKMFLNEVKNIDIKNFHAICLCLDDRLSWMEFREPDSDGIIHDNWEEKYDEFSEIIEKAEDIKDVIKNCDYQDDDLKILFEELSEMILDYQTFYGGLSRLKLNF